MENKYFRFKKELAELIGIIIGDGNIYYKPEFRKYYFEITGDPNLEVDYFNYISDLVYKILRKRPSIRFGRGLMLRLYSKEFVEFLINVIKLPHGRIKGSSVTIPKYVESRNWNTLKLCIRGITDTDGSLFLSKKSHRNDYPCIEISTISKSLAFQLKKLLESKYRIGFRLQSKRGLTDRYIISVNGDNMVNKWIKDIGFSNKRKIKCMGQEGFEPSTSRASVSPMASHH